MTRPLVIVGLVALLLTGSACNTPSASNTERRHVVTPFEQQQARQAYVDSQYDKFLKGSRAPDENAARAMAGLEWDTQAHRQSQSDNDGRVRWSSDTRRRTSNAPSSRSCATWVIDQSYPRLRGWNLACWSMSRFDSTAV